MSARRPWWSDDSPPVTLYAVNETRRPTNALVVLAAGTGNDQAALASALKRLKRIAGDNGTYTKLRRDSELWQFYPRGERRRRKSVKARARAKKAALRREAFEARYDRRRPSPPREVMVAA